MMMYQQLDKLALGLPAYRLALLTAILAAARGREMVRGQEEEMMRV